MERAYRKYQNGQVWAPGITEYCLYSSLNFRKIKRICMENVAGEQSLALSNNFDLFYKSQAIGLSTCKQSFVSLTHIYALLYLVLKVLF